MGWKPGQGIGPRLSRLQKKKNRRANVRMFGNTLSKSYLQDAQGEGDGEQGEDEMETKYKQFLFAPDDIPDFVAKPKDNTFGISYSGLDKSEWMLSNSKHVNLFEPLDDGPSLKVRGTKSNKSVKIRGQAFGVGAYEEEDEDIYARDDMSKYDFEVSESNESSSVKKRRSRWDDKGQCPVDQIIEGFKKASLGSATLEKTFFPPPTVPKNWQPKKRGKKTRFQQDPTTSTTNPTPQQRRETLAAPGEQEESDAKVTDSDEQLKQFLSTNVPGKGSSVVSGLSSFQPFARDEEKQKRYEKYLVCVRNKREDALYLLQPKNMTEWEREREKVEFARAAMLYRPLSGSMGSKFVSAGSSQDVADDTSMEVPVGGDPPANDAEKAAKMKMFGKLTRERVEWHPAKMLCVRFNVKHPYGDYSVVGVPVVRKSKFELFNFINDPTKSTTAAIPEPEAEASDVKEVVEPPKAVNENDDTSKATVPSPRDDDKVEPEEEKEKPSLDLFRSIFLDSSEEEDSDSEEAVVDAGTVEPKADATEKKDEKAELFGTELESRLTTKPMPWEEKKQNLLRNMSPAKGIFANVDFDALNRKKKKELPLPEKKPPEKTEEPKRSGEAVKRPRAADFLESESEGEEDTFGPSKPPAGAKVDYLAKFASDDSDDAGRWSERTTSRKKVRRSSKKSKSKHKKSKKAKKAKKRKKKKSKKSASTSESSSSDTDS